MSRVRLLLLATLTLLGPSAAHAQPTNTTEITALAFTPDGKTVVSAGLDGSVRLWDAADGKEKQRVEAHKGGVYGGALSPDGKRFASGGVDGLVCLWDTATLKQLRVFEDHRGDVVAVAFAPDGKTLATGGSDKAIRLWDVDTGKIRLQFHGHEVKVTSLAFAPDGKTLLSGGIGNVVIPGLFINAQHADQACLWDTTTGKLIRRLPQRGSQVAIAPDGVTMATGGLVMTGNRIGKGVNLQGGSKVEVGGDKSGRDWLAIANQGGGLAFSADGKFLATTWGSRQHLGNFRIENQTVHRRVALWELATGKECLQLAEDGATVVALARDGRKLAAGRLNGTVVMLETKPAGWNADAAGKWTPEEVDKAWVELGGDNPVAAYRLRWDFYIADYKALVLFKDKLRPVEPGGERVAKLLANLDSKNFKARENAFRELKKLGAKVEPELRQTLRKKTSDEVRERVQKLLAGIDPHPATPEELRQARALQILTWIGDDDAEALLSRLAAGAPGAWLTGEAQAGLRYLRWRRVNQP